jgi:sec-independent protein translocase protein TatB
MFDLGLPELLVIAAIAILVVPPKDLPGLMRTVGRSVGKARKMFRDFQRELDKATRIDELEDIKKQVSDIRRQTDAEFAKDLVVRPPPRPTVLAGAGPAQGQIAAQADATPPNASSGQTSETPMQASAAVPELPGDLESEEAAQPVPTADTKT